MNNVCADLYADDTILYGVQNSNKTIEHNLQIGLNQLHIGVKQWDGFEFSKNESNVDNFLSET